MSSRPIIKKPVPLTPPNPLLEYGTDRPDWRAWHKALKQARFAKKQQRKNKYRAD